MGSSPAEVRTSEKCADHSARILGGRCGKLSQGNSRGRLTAVMLARKSTPLLAGGVAVAIGCSGGEPSLPCVANLDLGCAPLYAPTYDQIFTRTLHPTCAQAGGSCHAAAGAQGGLVFEDENAAYALLLGETEKRARVVPG